MSEWLFWLYLINVSLLICHEIDAAYWKEWRLFGSKMDIAGFLMLHFLLVPLVLSGLVLVARQTGVGVIASLILSVIGITVFLVHRYFFKKGRPEFRTPVSFFILGAILVTSLIQGWVSLSSFLWK